MRLTLRRLRVAALAGLVAAAPLAAVAVQPDEILPDPKLEARARAISADLRCLVCQNQSIDDSDAPLARDLRVLVREQIRAGKDDAQVRDYLVARYGDFILLKPPVKLQTLLLWGLPFLVVAAGAAGLMAAARRKRAAPAAAPLSDEERRRLAALVGKPD
ncbi:MAG: cytochrome c-type biogenesis protein CcmH [Methylobacteriaceae bacterium]|nr:cytochrome c-type biogenesis protein CcmH [Methylobacteriaceae bacterium]